MTGSARAGHGGRRRARRVDSCARGRRGAPFWLPALMIARRRTGRTGGWTKTRSSTSGSSTRSSPGTARCSTRASASRPRRARCGSCVLVVGRARLRRVREHGVDRLVRRPGGRGRRVRDRRHTATTAACTAASRRRGRAGRTPPGRRGRGRLGLLHVRPRDGTRVAVARVFVVGADNRGAVAKTIRRRTRVAGCVVLGLAPLVRPELTLMMLCFLVAWFVLARPRRIVLDLVAIFAIPVAYEIFRMGYYATIVPNTALAKDAGGLHLGQGWTYLHDFVSPYRLWVSALAHRGRRSCSRRSGVPTAGLRSRPRAMLVAALVDMLYIVAIGGDYMHGRLLFPAFFALGAPRVDSRCGPESSGIRRGAAAVAAIGAIAAVWALVSVIWFRPPPPAARTRARSGADLRLAHGIGRDDAPGRRRARPQRQRGRGRHTNAVCAATSRSPTRPRARLVIPTRSCSRWARSACPRTTPGRHVFVIDIGGLAEPLAARTDPIPGRQAGHRKQIDYAWYDAMLRRPEHRSRRSSRHGTRSRASPVKDLIESVDAPMTPGRFLSNILHSVSYTRLHVPTIRRVADATGADASRSRRRSRARPAPPIDGSALVRNRVLA